MIEPTFIYFYQFDIYANSKEFISEDSFYDAYFLKTEWESNKFNSILKAIANDKKRAIFIVRKSKIIIAPYDSGVDFIIPDNELKDKAKFKFAYWLSEREEGL